MHPCAVGGLAARVDAARACETGVLLSEGYRLNGRWMEAEARAREAERRAREAGLGVWSAKAQRALADILRLRGAYVEALDWLVRALEGFEKAGDRAGRRQTLWTMGEVYWYIGRNDDALRVLSEQLYLAQADGDARSAADALASQGMVHWSMGAFETARLCCDRAVALGESSGNQFAVSRASITEGNIESGLNDAAAAVAWYARAHGVATHINDLQAAIWAVANTSDILGWLLDDPQTALAYVVGAFELALTIGDRWTFCQTLVGAGVYANELDRVEAAERYLTVGCAIGRELGMPTYLANMLKELAIFLLRRGRAQEADAVLGEIEVLVRDVSGERVGGGDMRFVQAVLRIRIDAALGRSTQTEAMTRMLQLEARFGELEQRAAIHYEVWRLDAARADDREAAVAAYREVIARRPHRVARDRLFEMTGERLPLPCLGDPLGLRPAEFDLDRVLAWIDGLVARLQAEASPGNTPEAPAQHAKQRLRNALSPTTVASRPKSPA